ncbi:hypothetical protein RB653_006681 [Dictyostelium firmibasis]|uniref:Cytochrome b5 heme-binding domain-containing protein n=1 Tax=Dictyostelium firmibasis TaxID=79012 RepID=A0AAN7TUA5_9MYCE
MMRFSKLIRCTNSIIKSKQIQRSFISTSFVQQSSKSTLTLNNNNNKYIQKRSYASSEDEPWLLEKLDPSILKDDHPGYPFSELVDTTLPEFTLQEVSRHNTREDCWIIINEKVYNVSSYVSSHPGGDMILQNAGGESTTLFKLAPMTSYAHIIMKDFHIGYCRHQRRFDGFTERQHDEHH